MRFPSCVRLAGLIAISVAMLDSPLVAQSAEEARTLDSTPAHVPEDLWDIGCTRWDEWACDMAPSPPLYDPPVVGSWVRISLLRNSFSVQPPDAPLYLFIDPNGYWSMFEFPAHRPRIDKPLEEQTPAELHRRFHQSAGAYGWWTYDGEILNRHHEGGVGPGAEGGPIHIREAVFEDAIMALLGTGSSRSPQARMRRLPVQPLSSRELVGTWERTALTVDGQPVTGPTLQQFVYLGQDGWFQQNVMPVGRTNPGKPRSHYTTEDYVAAFTGLSLARGTYDIVDGNKLVRFHAANLDPNLTGWSEVAEFSLSDETMTLQGIDEKGARIRATYNRLPPRDLRPQP